MTEKYSCRLISKITVEMCQFTVMTMTSLNVSFLYKGWSNINKKACSNAKNKACDNSIANARHVIIA